MPSLTSDLAAAAPSVRSPAPPRRPPPPPRSGSSRRPRQRPGWTRPTRRWSRRSTAPNGRLRRAGDRSRRARLSLSPAARRRSDVRRCLFGPRNDQLDKRRARVRATISACSALGSAATRCRPAPTPRRARQRRQARARPVSRTSRERRRCACRRSAATTAPHQPSAAVSELADRRDPSPPHPSPRAASRRRGPAVPASRRRLPQPAASACPSAVQLRSLRCARRRRRFGSSITCSSVSSAFGVMARGSLHVGDDLVSLNGVWPGWPPCQVAALAPLPRG